jgi:hypothetical protein
MNNKIIYITNERRKRDFKECYDRYSYSNVMSMSNLWNFMDYLKDNLYETYIKVYTIMSECYNLSLLPTEEGDDFDESISVELGVYYLTIKNMIDIRNIIFELNYDDFTILTNLYFIPKELSYIWNFYYIYVEKRNRESALNEEFSNYFLEDDIVDIIDDFLVKISANKNKVFSCYEGDTKEKLLKKTKDIGKELAGECKDFIYF